MVMRELLALSVLASVAGCVTRTHEENAARRSTWPVDTEAALAAARPDSPWPSTTGDILRGTSPAELAATRARIRAPLTQALARP